MITGGTDNDGIYGDPVKRVTSYNHKGFLADLPELLESRIQHGCSHFLNNENQLVSLLMINNTTVNCIIEYSLGFYGGRWLLQIPKVKISGRNRDACRG